MGGGAGASVSAAMVFAGMLGEAEEGSKEKPRRASLPKGMDPAAATLEFALKLLSLPRTLGTHPETGKEIQANIGRFGPYVVHDGDFRSLTKEAMLLLRTMVRCV